MRISPWLASAALIALGACANGGGARLNALTPTEHYAIQVTPAPQEIKLAAHTQGLSANQEDALRDFVADWRQADGPAITLKAPEHGPDPAGAYRTATEARDMLVSLGVAPSQVRIVGYEAVGDVHAPILVGFVRYEAKGPACGRSWSNLAAVDGNHEYAEFGCAVTANMAAQIADPADILAPRTETPPDAARRDAALGKYRQAQITSTPKDAQADGTLSTVGQ